MGLILNRLERAIPESKTALLHNNPFELLVATILSAQCTDARVNQVTPTLFQVYKTVTDFAKTNCRDLEKRIQSVNFYRNKAKAIIGTANKIIDSFGGMVPNRMEQLLTLPGIGRKTANVVLMGFGIPAVVVDTHVRRVANRLQLTKSSDPDQIEFDLNALMPKSKWISGSARLLLHGRHLCRARRPLCQTCTLFDLCPADYEKRAAGEKGA